MAGEYREFSFNDDIELMNLTYKMNTGNFMDYEDELSTEDEKINNVEIKRLPIGL